MVELKIITTRKGVQVYTHDDYVLTFFKNHATSTPANSYLRLYEDALGDVNIKTVGASDIINEVGQEILDKLKNIYDVQE